MYSPSWLSAGILVIGACTVSLGVGGPHFVSAATNVDATTTLTINGPTGSGHFGDYVTVLTNGNFVVDDPFFDGAAADIGAVYLYNGATNQLISRTTGSSAGDRVGSDEINEVGGGNFVINSSHWRLGAAANAGASTWVNGTTGLDGPVSALNSLVGSQPNDSVGVNGEAVLTNGNYVVLSPIWANGAVAKAGAATFGTGAAGVTGAVTAANSLVGTTFDDQVGTNAVALTNGNYVVASPIWGSANIGAVTWGNGTLGVVGVVSAGNSLIGGLANDAVGGDGVVPLTNGSYAVVSTTWSNTVAAPNAGAVTWGNGTTGTPHGVVSSANSLVGTGNGDRVGKNGVTTLTNGNYVVDSSAWGGASNFGAVTWGSGTVGVHGTVSSANSLVGTTAQDTVGGGGVVALTNGNYVVASDYWDGVGGANAGAATWGNGVTGSPVGSVTAANSIVGSVANDFVSDGGVTALTNGNYVVNSPFWNGLGTDVGAVTWGNGNGGTVSTLGSINSFIGSSLNDNVGSVRTVALANGNYVVVSPVWDGAITDGGAVTFGNGATGSHAVVSGFNSLIGSNNFDHVGSSAVVALTNGNYVVGSGNWANGGVVSAGAATWGSGTVGIAGIVSTANSLVGTTALDQVGTHVQALPDGRYAVGEGGWDSTATGKVNVGAITWADGAIGLAGSVSPANSLTGSTADDGIDIAFQTSVDGYLVLPFVGWDNGSIVDASAVTLAPPAGLVGSVTNTNSALGTVTNPNMYPSGRFTTDLAIVIATSLNQLILLRRDVTPPAFGATPTITAVAPPGAAGVAVALAPVATDNRGAPTVACTPSSGSVFPVGSTIVSCTATDGVGLTASTVFSVSVSSGADYVPLPPARLADTRPNSSTVDGSFAGGGAVAGGTTLQLQVGGRGGVPVDATAVAMNVTVTEASAAGFVTVFPCGSIQPTASNLNYAAGSTIPNAVITKVGLGGAVCIFSQQTVQLVVDVNGAFPPTTSFTAINPARVIDTRTGSSTIDGMQQGGGAVAAASVTPVTIASRAGLPADASAVVLNVTVTEPSAAGFATVYPCGSDVPKTSNLNYTAGLTIPNLVIARIGAGGAVCVFTQASTHLIVDVLGYFPAITSFVALQPARLLDTRPAAATIDGASAGAGLRPAGTVTVVHVAGRGGVPAAAKTAVLNVTVTDPTGSGFVTVYPCGIDPPLASNLNFGAGQTIPGAVITELGANGDVCLFNSAPTDLIADVNGYFPG